jgi:hypothetical protein
VSRTSSQHHRRTDIRLRCWARSWTQVVARTGP